MKNKIIYTGAVLLLLGLVGNLKAQSLEDIKQQYRGNELVFLKYNKTVEISLKNGEPTAESKQENELLVLSEKNPNVYSKYSVYHSSYNELKTLEAYTLVDLGDGKTRKIEVGDMQTSSSPGNSVFYDDVKQTSFNFPALATGAIEHVEYTQYNKDCHLLSPFHLPGYVPVVNATFTLTVPNDVEIKYIVKNDPNGIFNLEIDKRRQTTIYKWTAKHIKSEKDYRDAPDDRYYLPHIIYHISSYTTKSGKQNFLSSLDDLYRWNAGFLKNLNVQEDPFLKALVDSLTKKETNDHAKARKIYKWVQEHIKYVAFENGIEGFRPRQANDVYNKRYGDCKDMSSIITTMLRMAGIKAYYTWIGTRSIPYDYTEIPLPIVDNHMIATALIDGGWVFLDGTDPHAQYGLPPYSIQTKQALIGISDTEYKVERVPLIEASKSVLTDSTFITFSTDGIKGNERVNYTGYFGEEIYNSLLYKDEKTVKDYVKSRMGKASNKFILGNYTIDRAKPTENIVNIHADFEVPGYGKKMGNEYFINLQLEKIFENGVIDTAKRKVPIESDFKYEIRQHHILEIPQGYKVTYQPKNFSFENDMIGIDIHYKQKENQIIASQVIVNKKLMIFPHEFGEWNKAMKAVAAQYKEQVVLEKK